MKTLLAILLILNSPLSFAAEWNCSNQDMEISCSEGTCKSASGFTPMSIHFNSKGSMRICAYMGCWTGEGKTLVTGNYTIVAGHNLTFTSSRVQDDMRSDFLLTINTADHLAMISGYGYTMPITCQTVANE